MNYILGEDRSQVKIECIDDFVVVDKDMLKLFIYGYFNGIRSSRRLANQSIMNKEVIWLINGLQPKYSVIANFRKDNIDALY